MHRRIAAQELRGSDVTMLEVQLQNLLRRPMGQMAPENLLDLLALSEIPEAPKSISTQLEQFVLRCSTELAELPQGEAWNNFIVEIEDIGGDRVPETFRAWMARESARNDSETPKLDALMATWAGVPPTPFTLGEANTKVERGATKAANASAATSTAKRPRASTKKAKIPAAPKRDVGGNTSPERKAIIDRILMERLNGATEKGLLENVLVAGTRHRCKEYNEEGVTPAEVLASLRSLKDQGRVRYSARRWIADRRW